MADVTDSAIVGCDARAVVDAAREAAGDSLRTVVEYDIDTFRPLYVDETTRSMYRSEARMYDHFDRIHAFVHVDFTERDLFQEDLLPPAGDVRAIVTEMEGMTLVRILRGDCGLFLGVDPDVRTSSLVDAVRPEFAPETRV